MKVPYCNCEVYVFVKTPSQMFRGLLWLYDELGQVDYASEWSPYADTL